MSTTTYDEVRENLAQAIEAGATLVPAGLSMKFWRQQGPASMEASENGRQFSVSGPKADKVRALIFADLGLTRRQIADLVDCSVSRVSEVVWGLEHDDVEFPTIPLRAAKPEAAKPDPVVVADQEANDQLVAMLEASIAERQAQQAAEGEQPEGDSE